MTDLKLMIRRGMAGRIAEGRSAGGIQYGYDVLPPEEIAGRKKPRRGGRRINEQEAAVVRRIFARYLEGGSPKMIAKELNAEGVPPPRGRFWRSNTITGHRDRGDGILRNELYAGTLVWNRVTMVRDPVTRRRVIRVNPESEWKRVEVPDLAIIDRATFDKAQGTRLKRSTATPRERLRARRILSGLLRCGVCGQGMASCGPDRGGTRIQCAGARDSGACNNRRRYYLQPIERAVVGGLRQRLGSPAAIALYLETLEEERRKLRGDVAGNRRRLETRLATIEREITRAVQLVMMGVLTEEEAAAQLPALRAERDRHKGELAAIADETPIVMHPGTVQRYLKDLVVVDWMLNQKLAEGHEDVGAALRALIDKVAVVPAPNGVPPMVRVSGHLESLLAPFSGRSLSVGQVVAEEGLEPPTRGL